MSAVAALPVERTVRSSCPTSIELVRALPRGASVADVGCHGWVLGEACLAASVHYVGIDQIEPPRRPAHARFILSTGTSFALADDACDLVVAGHVLEHVTEPIAFMAELMRIVKPGGQLWVESPSELACHATGSSDPEDHAFESFWDDPTHIRPWTPGALYRLALTCQAIPLAIQRGKTDGKSDEKTGGIPVSTMLAMKPDHARGKPATRYVTLKNTAYGLKAAYESVWGGVQLSGLGGGRTAPGSSTPRKRTRSRPL